MNWPTSASRLASVSLCAVGLLSFATSCEKANDLGLDLPGTSPISATYLDLPLRASTVRQQPVQTVKADQFLVGRLQDAYVGTTTASTFMNLLALSSPDSLPAKYTALRLDSVILNLPFDQVYGSAARPLRLDLLPLQRPLDERTIYTSESSAATDNALLTGFEAPLNRNKTVKQRVQSGNSTDTTTTVITVQVPDRTIRIPFLKSAGTAALANSLFVAMQNAAFGQSGLDAIWKGFLLQPANGHTANIVGFPRTPSARVVFYFRGTSADGKVRARNYSLYLASLPPLTGSYSDGKYFTQITTSFAGTALAGLTPQTALPSAATNGLTYVQEGVGLATRIEFQGLDALRDDATLAINRAELLIPIKQFSNGLFPYNSGLYLYEVNDANQPLIRTSGVSTAERLIQVEGIVKLSNGSTFRASPTTVGAPAAATFPLGQNPAQYYTVSVTEYLQAYLQNRLDGELPTGLLLSPILRSATSLNLNRAQLDANEFKLRVYYSKLR
ncbi:DUF4270 family protein [Hymenobacter rubripertinctus]|uniref:DUF4270 family protein n=1 Tax=Hymenobacter rubripertinctus TaxID=2029981 RepID=A0A418QRW9_9BACT|nr:DUF4270 family protein [Hymenobacter rubripertinctus]RIY07966.1 DUF4270 family protein [Hymenobacter rubripertinctus]